MARVASHAARSPAQWLTAPTANGAATIASAQAPFSRPIATPLPMPARAASRLASGYAIVVSVARGATVSAIVVRAATPVPLQPAGRSAKARTTAATAFV